MQSYSQLKYPNFCFSSSLKALLGYLEACQIHSFLAIKDNEVFLPVIAQTAACWKKVTHTPWKIHAQYEILFGPSNVLKLYLLNPLHRAINIYHPLLLVRGTLPTSYVQKQPSKPHHVKVTSFEIRLQRGMHALANHSITISKYSTYATTLPRINH